jgi:hypothetical protein
VLEIGEDVGALIVYTDPGLRGTEVEISPTADDRRRSHKEVLERTAGGGCGHVLVFDGVSEGAHTLWIGGSPRAREVRVEGGAIAELDWRGLSEPHRRARA